MQNRARRDGRVVRVGQQSAPRMPQNVAGGAAVHEGEWVLA